MGASLAKVSLVSSLVAIAQALSKQVNKLRFGEPVAYVYNPLDYASASHAQYCERFGKGPKRYLWLGMNPGPFGMAQTGVPFGEIEAVTDWMGIAAPVKKPSKEHPKRPIQGFDCPRSEVSGKRLWGYIESRWGDPEEFFASSFVYNYCPLLFVHETGKNITPDKLAVAEQKPLFEACDRALAQSVEALQVECIVAVGVFAQKQAKRVLKEHELRHARVLHPSPASPIANRGWASAAQKELEDQGLYLDVPQVQL